MKMETIEILETDVLIRGARKEYERGQKILDDLNMTVKKGSIYGLLGASGCGKTTLLGAVVGCKKLQNGYISILGHPPGIIPQKSIGYMPQETSLLEEFNIKNCLQYQGYIYGMSDEKIKERHEFLEKLLDLPPGDRLVRQLSGGQERRLSLAVTLVHDPDLLILDEPTVGLDPILRQNLWDYFIKITEEEHKTVIITTHYLEEAKQAHTIGLLRNGQILSEGEPQALLRENNCSTVEDLFALLSIRQEEMKITAVSPSKKESTEFKSEKKLSKTNSFKKFNFLNLGHAKALILKNIVRFIRNPEIILIAFCFPIIIFNVFFPVIGVIPNDIHIGIVNEELFNYSNCHDYASNNNNLIGGELLLKNNETDCVYRGLGCMFIENLGSIIANKIYFKTEDEALKAMKNGRFHFILHFPKNYSKSVTIIRRDEHFEDEDLEFGQVTVYRDVKDWTIGLEVEKELLKTYQRFAGKLATDCNINKKAEDWPIRFKEPIYGKTDGSFFKEFTAPGIILLGSIFSPVGLSLITYVAERFTGCWERTIVSGVATTEILFFDTIFICLIALIQLAEISVIAFVIYNIECRGNFFSAFFIIYLQSITAILEGTLISIKSKTVGESLQFGTGVFISKLFTSGSLWPIEGMPNFLRYLCYLSPQTLPLEALRSILYRGWGISHFPVLLGFLTSVGFIIFFAGLCVITLKFERK